MRWPQEPPENAVTRRDDNLARTRRLTAWIAGGAIAASFGLAAALGYALPGRSYASTPAGQTGSVTGQRGTTSGTSGGQRSKGGGTSGTSNSGGGTSNSGNGGLAPPQQPPGSSVSPPVVSSGGS